MHYRAEIISCQTCRKEFLVERSLIGVDHTASTIVSCKECLQSKPLPKAFIKGHPEEAKNIQKWLKEKKQAE